MAFEQKDMTGAVFANSKKDKDTHPDRTGDCTIDGRKYWISGWVKQDKNGKQYLSLSFKPKEGAADARSSAPVKPRTARPMTLSETLDDEVPF